MKTSIPFLARRAAAVSLLALGACGGFGTDAIIGGDVSGLATGLSVVLSNNGTDNLTVSSNGSFVFSGTIAPGSSYAVAVATQPLGQTCSVANASGKVNAAGGDVKNIAVSCLNTASIVVTVAGLLSGGGLTLSNGVTLLPVAANGTSAFPGLLTPGTAYAVTITVQPVNQTCTLSANATGTIPASGIVAVTVACL